MSKSKKGVKKLTPEEKEARMAGIVAKRVAGRNLVDGYGDPIVDKTRGRNPTEKEKAAIRRSLRMRPLSRFSRCDNRDYHRAESLDREEGFTLEDIRAKRGHHTLEKHVCRECRCRQVAGSGTRGWWYWTRENREGHGEIGHYGVGKCYKHSPLYSLRMGGMQIDRYKEMVSRMIDETRELGLAPDKNGGDLTVLREAAKVAEIRMNTKAGLEGLFRLADETLTKLNEHTQECTTIEEAIEGVCEVFGVPMQMLDRGDRDRLRDLWFKKPLTELARGVPVSMSDKTAIELKKALLKDVVTSAKSVFEVHEDDYTHNDEVVRLLERFYSQAEVSYRAFGEEEWNKFITSLKDIGRNFADKALLTTGELEE
jgi:hypothetical protein